MPEAVGRQVVGGAGTVVPYQVLVGLGAGVKASVEPGRDGLGGQNQGISRQVEVERGLDLAVWKLGFGAKMGHQAPGVDPAVGPGAGYQVGLALEDLGKVLFEELLERAARALALPAIVAGALEGD